MARRETEVLGKCSGGETVDGRAGKVLWWWDGGRKCWESALVVRGKTEVLGKSLGGKTLDEESAVS